MRQSRRRGFVVSAVVGLVAAGTGTGASAYWAGSGNGAGTAATGNTESVTLSPALAAPQLFPGGQAAVSLTVANPNPGSVRVGSLALDTTRGSGGFAADAAHATCGLSVLTFATQTNGGSGWAIPGGGSSPVTLPNALSMGAGAAGACQGASITVYLKAGA
jgi:hypothetical protein